MPATRRSRRSAAPSFRYAGQDHPLSVELPPRDDAADSLAVARERFHEKHERLYGFRRDDTPVELVRIQVSVIGRIERMQRASQRAGDRIVAEPKGARELYLDGAFRPCPTYDRVDLVPGATLAGPSVVEERGSTTYVPPDFELTIPGDGTMRITAGAP